MLTVSVVGCHLGLVSVTISQTQFFSTLFFPQEDQKELDALFLLSPFGGSEYLSRQSLFKFVGVCQDPA